MGWIALGMKLLPFIVEAVSWVEKFITAKGKYKQDAAVYMVKSILGVAESGANRDLLNDDEVEEATRKVIDAVVALNNIVASKQPQ
tara:strand:+ start:26266 stop:26523 length:258 start_codon:yes stop_codon:yes gene_type:complete